MHRLYTAMIAAALVVSVASCAGDDSPTTGASRDGNREVRTVEVAMVDMAFQPDRIEVDRGETVRFRFTNRGAVTHDAFIGDNEAQAGHGAAMTRASDSDGHGGHDDEAEDAVTIEPGGTGELTYTFDEPAALQIGCHQPGHYEAGMKITVQVT